MSATPSTSSRSRTLRRVAADERLDVHAGRGIEREQARLERRQGLALQHARPVQVEQQRAGSCPDHAERRHRQREAQPGRRAPDAASAGSAAARAAPGVARRRPRLRRRRRATALASISPTARTCRLAGRAEHSRAPRRVGSTGGCVVSRGLRPGPRGSPAGLPTGPSMGTILARRPDPRRPGA